MTTRWKSKKSTYQCF